MTDLDELIARIDTVLVENDATQLPALPTEPACCDLHNERCEVPFNTCCARCPEEVALAEFVAEHRRAQREDQALIEASIIHRGPLVTVTEVGPRVEPRVYEPMPANWWRRIFRP